MRDGCAARFDNPVQNIFRTRAAFHGARSGLTGFGRHTFGAASEGTIAATMLAARSTPCQFSAGAGNDPFPTARPIGSRVRASSARQPLARLRLLRLPASGGSNRCIVRNILRCAMIDVILAREKNRTCVFPQPRTLL